MTNDEAYQLGVLDSLNNAPPLLGVLYAAEEYDAAESYLDGQMTGDQLQTGAELLVLER